MDRLAEYAAEGVATFGDPDTRLEVTSPEAAREAIGDLDGMDREVAVVLLLDTKHRLMSRQVVSVGSIDHTFMTPREIFREALAGNASAIVVAHNHPSGDAEPSRDDEAVTRRLVAAGELIGIDMLDALVIGTAGRWTSLARQGVV